MARKIQRFTIDGTQYEFTQLGAVEGKDLFHDLRKLAIPALKGLLTGDLLTSLVAEGPDALDKVESAKVGELIGMVLSLFESMPKSLERDLCSAFARACKVATPETQGALIAMGDANLPDGVFDQHFAGQYGLYQKWLLQGLKFNFASFLGASGSFGAPAPQATPSA